MVSLTLSVVRRISSASSSAFTSSTSLRKRLATGWTRAKVPRGSRRYRTVTPAPPPPTAAGRGGSRACEESSPDASGMVGAPARPSMRRTGSGIPMAPSGAVKSSSVAWVEAPLGAVISKAAMPL
eukprot:scaffold14003_cov35-Tisochrysis_lutea.AAC.2